MATEPDEVRLETKLRGLLGMEPDREVVSKYRDMISQAASAGMPIGLPSIEADHFFPEKEWDVLAVSGFMCEDPYTGLPGVETLEDGVYRVTVRLAGSHGQKRITTTLRFKETFEQSRLVFNPLLNRFLAGEDYQNRAVKISDSGRIRNELQTLCSEALEFLPDDNIRLSFEAIPDEVISPDNQRMLRKILQWYKKNHPLWFSWLELG
jgi:hypothetical protein